MSSFEMRHPEEGLLLPYVDGELSARKARQVRRHVEACWQCRSRLEDLQKTVGECVRYRQDVLVQGLPAAPRPWMDLSREFDRIDASLERAPLWSRPLFRWAGLAAAALALVWLIGTQLRQPPAVEAAPLLRRAIAASQARPPAIRRIRIRTRSQQLVRTVQAPATTIEMPPEIASMFASAHYDGSDALSARSYLAWHKQLSTKQDEVATREDRYEIRTTTPSNELAEARLTLRAVDLQPIEGRFEFRNRDWVEMTELPPQDSPASTVARTDGVSPSVPGRAAERPPTAEPQAASLADELQAVTALHQVGADLGDPVEVGREGGRVVVSGTGLSAERQQEITAALAALPNVVLRFAQPAAPPAGAPQTAGGAASAPAPSNLQSRVEAQLGNRQQWENFTSQLLDRNDAVMTRAYALRRLAQQFPTEAQGQFSAADRELLKNVGREHLEALTRETAALSASVSPVLTGMGATPVETQSGPVAPTANWQGGAEELFHAARRVETLSAALLGVSPDPPAGDIPSNLLTALARLQADVQQCERLLNH